MLKCFLQTDAEGDLNQNTGNVFDAIIQSAVSVTDKPPTRKKRKLNVGAGKAIELEANYNYFKEFNRTRKC